MAMTRNISMLIHWLFWICVILHNTCSELVPSFLQEPKSTVVRSLGGVVLTCRVTPSTASVQWLYHGQILSNNPEQGITISQNSLHIDEFRKSRHKGLYYCLAKVSSGSILSKPALLSSPSIEEFSPSPDKSVTTTVGNTVVLPCQPPNSNPAAVISFLVNSTVITGDDRHKIMPSGNLYISSVRKDDDGMYECVATNSVNGRNRTAPYSISLKVLEAVSSVAPAFVPVSPTNLTADLGSDVMLECAVRGQPPPVTYWQRYGMMMSVNRTQNILGNLLIKKVDVGDEGTYICRMKDQGLEQIYTLDVQVPPVVHISNPNMLKYEGESVTINCQDKSKDREHPPAIQWFHNSNELDPAIANGTVVRIEKLQLSDSGLYQCMAISKTGMVSAVAKLEVRLALPGAQPPTTTHSGTGTGRGKGKGSRKRGNRHRRKKHKRKKNKGKKLGKKGKSRTREGQAVLVPPSRPEVSKVDDTSVQVNWTVRENDGLKITFFRVQYKELKPNKGKWITIEEDIPIKKKKFNVKQLVPGHTYKFRIAAVYTNNDNRFGPNSKRFTLEKGNLVSPKKPSIIDVQPLEVDTVYSLNVKWRYMSEDGVPIDGFYLEYSVYSETLTDDDYTKIPLVQPNARRYLIKDLLPATEYTVRIKCFNQAGDSEYSFSAVKKTPGKDSKVPPFLPMTVVTHPTVVNHPTVVSKGNNSIVITYTPETPLVGDSSTADAYRPRNSTESSSEMLYMVLGIVLGVMMLALIVFMVMCGIKQRQQRRRMDSMGKKYMNGGFALNGINGNVGNHPGNNHCPSEGPKMNISVNPLSEPMLQSSQVETALPASPTVSDNNFNTISNKTVACQPDCVDESCRYTRTKTGDESVSSSQESHSSTSSLPDYRHCLAVQANRCCSCSQSHVDHSPQHSNTAIDHRPVSAASSNASYHQHHHHRRRRKHRSKKEHTTRDQATNTDLSSNDGTMEGSSIPEINKDIEPVVLDRDVSVLDESMSNDALDRDVPVLDESISNDALDRDVPVLDESMSNDALDRDVPVLDESMDSDAEELSGDLPQETVNSEENNSMCVDSDYAGVHRTDRADSPSQHPSHLSLDT